LYSKILEKRLENVKFEAEISESVNNSIKNITNASENVSSLISDLRCLSLPYKTEFSLKQFILNTVMQCEEKANKAEVEIKAEDFKDITVNTDKLKLQCTLTNLIYNAIEACKKGNKINTECIIRDNSINIYVKNNGDMIPTEIQGKIFDTEFTTKEEGNGLGLAVCKIQMEQINGSVELEKSDEKETVFKITLPVN
jgi:C4-dicarboxylate-specific signal transduction histidine kinase